MNTSRDATGVDSNGPRLCPKGYGICWTCDRPCNEPGVRQTQFRPTASPYDVGGNPTKEYPGE